MQDVVYKYLRTRNFPVPNRTDQTFEIEVWIKVEEDMAKLNEMAVTLPPENLIMALDQNQAIAVLQNMNPLPSEKKMPKVSSVWARGKLLLVCTTYPFLDPGDDISERSGRILGEFLVSDIEYYPPEDGFRQAAKLKFTCKDGDNPDREDSEGRYGRRRRYSRHDDRFVISFVRYKANHNYTAKMDKRVTPVLKEHVQALLYRITKELPGTIKTYDRWDIADYLRKITEFMPDFVRLYGKNGYRKSGAFLALLDRYLRAKKHSLNKLGNEFCDWLDAEARSRVVRKLLKEAEEKHGKDWSIGKTSHYSDVVLHNPERNPITEAHVKVKNKFYAEQHKKLKAQERNLRRKEARQARKAAKATGEDQDPAAGSNGGTIVGQVGETLRYTPDPDDAYAANP